MKLFGFLNKDIRRCPKCGKIIVGYKKWVKHKSKCKATKKKGLFSSIKLFVEKKRRKDN